MIRPVLPYVEYAVNKSYIVQYLCENRDKPRLKCDGKCYLAKQLKVAQSTSDEPAEETPSVDLREYPYALMEVIPSLDYHNEGAVQSDLPHNPNITEGAKTAIFRPPIFLS
jgi:hypothetical protein